METKECKLCKVGYPATTEHFYLKKDNKDGLTGRCKTCYSIPSERKESAPKGFKKCNNCGEILSATEEYFRNKKERNDRYALYHICKECESILKKEYRDSHKEEISIYNKTWHDSNIDVVRSLYERYYNNNKEYENKRTNKYYNNNKESIFKLVKINIHKRKAKLKGLDHSYNKDQWEECKKYFNNKCAYCGKEENLAQEHFIALSKGGEYTRNNIIPACKKCNSSKRDKDFFIWYSKQKFYNKARERFILKYLNYKDESQQLRIL